MGIESVIIFYQVEVREHPSTKVVEMLSSETDEGFSVCLNHLFLDCLVYPSLSNILTDVPNNRF